MTDDPNRIQAVENVFDVIENVGELGSCGVRELADHMDIPKSTAHVYLKTLEDVGYVINQDGNYSLSLRFLNIGGRARHNMSLYQVGRSEVDELAHTTGEVATMGCEEDGYRVMLYRTEPTGAVFNNAPTGEYTQMHWTALGKALLSQKSDTEIRSIADRHGLPQATEHTIVNQDELLDEIETIRSQGYAVEDEERVKGVKSIAIPVENNGERSDAAISVAGPKHEFDDDRIQKEFLPALQNTANVVELKTKHY
ncbi:IclR family transcriptional regulator [Natronoarchaeum mannanilyticum]|uniref:IclR family transcriptional regulator n=1 Tax=Natronoarchaeum mannanilyticum TaxID=926360 RepID=A0AAV3TAB7_9EURY